MRPIFTWCVHKCRMYSHTAHEEVTGERTATKVSKHYGRPTPQNSVLSWSMKDRHFLKFIGWIVGYSLQWSNTKSKSTCSLTFSTCSHSTLPHIVMNAYLQTYLGTLEWLEQQIIQGYCILCWNGYKANNFPAVTVNCYHHMCHNEQHTLLILV